MFGSCLQNKLECDRRDNPRNGGTAPTFSLSIRLGPHTGSEGTLSSLWADFTTSLCNVPACR